jgi:hypothetical protein
VHCIVDNYGSHKHPKVKAWLAAKPGWHMHFFPTYSSWLNPIPLHACLMLSLAQVLDARSEVHDPRMPCQMVLTPGSPSPLRARKPPSMETSRTA